jgi:hypothetical protein
VYAPNLQGRRRHSYYFATLRRSDASTRAPPARCSVPPARALRSSKSSHLAAFSRSLNAGRAPRPASDSISRNVNPSAPGGGVAKLTLRLRTLLAAVPPPNELRRRAVAVDDEAPLSPPDERRLCASGGCGEEDALRMCDSDLRPAGMGMEADAGARGSAMRGGRATAAAMVTGRWALRSGRGGGGSAVALCGETTEDGEGSLDEGEEACGELGDARERAENVEERRRAGNALTAALVEKEGMVGDSARSISSVGSLALAAASVAGTGGRRRGGRGSDWSSTEGERTISQSSSGRGTRCVDP